ncbi:MAG: hypothetical protein ACYC67_24480 [Prosthecobacter sp.]
MNQRDVWAAPWQRGAQRPLDLPLRGGPGLGVNGGLVSVRDRAEKMERYVPDRLPGAVTTHPFKVSKDTTANYFKVKAGTCEGQTITAQTINVGATRPVAILAYPQYTLGIDSGEFVNSIAVKTGAYAPVLEASTSILSDVDSGITSAGTEGRALIAYIDVGDVISQITTGNIVGKFGDDGSRTGKAAGYYNKNF